MSKESVTAEHVGRRVRLRSLLHRPPREFVCRVRSIHEATPGQCFAGDLDNGKVCILNTQDCELLEVLPS